jgi:hypothetical protein
VNWDFEDPQSPGTIRRREGAAAKPEQKSSHGDATDIRPFEIKDPAKRRRVAFAAQVRLRGERHKLRALRFQKEAVAAQAD